MLSIVLYWCFAFCSVYFSDNFTWETYNAILLVRSFSKYFIELLPNEEVIRHMGGTVVKSQSDEEVAGFTGQVLHCTGDWGVMQIVLSNQQKKDIGRLVFLLGRKNLLLWEVIEIFINNYLFINLCRIYSVLLCWARTLILNNYTKYIYQEVQNFNQWETDQLVIWHKVSRIWAWDYWLWTSVTMFWRITCWNYGTCNKNDSSTFNKFY